MPHLPHPTPLAAALGAACLVLAACGGRSDKSPASPGVVTYAGIVADGPLQGATACYDLNDNAACDSGEPSAATDADGRFRFEVPSADAGRHAVIAEVPATAVDRDTGAAVGAAFTLKTPAPTSAAAGSVFVSPLTTLVVDVAAAQGLDRTAAEAAVRSQLGMANSPLANFVSGGDAQAARLAAAVNRVIVEVSRLAGDAGASGDAARALVAQVTTGDLATLAALVQASGAATPAEVAAEVAAAVIAARNLTPDTVREQAEAAAALSSAGAAAGAGGPFVSVRRFTWTDADNHQLQAFVGDSSALSEGRYAASEVRAHRVGGAEQPFNRNTAYWVAAQGAWVVCPLQWSLLSVKPATATTPQESVVCGASKTLARSVETDVSGRRMADVIRELRDSSLRDVPGFDTDPTGLPTRWGPEPAVLGDAVFPPGSTFALREQVNDAGGTERYSLTDKPRVVPATGSGPYRHAATFDDLRRMSGNLVDTAAVVTNLNSVFLEDLPSEQPNTAFQPVKRYRAALHPASDAVRFFACDVLASDNTSLNCAAVGDGSAAIAAQGDGRVLRFASGYPAALAAVLKRQRLFVERSGTVFGGWRDFERTAYQRRPNTVAWNALRETLGLAAPAAPQAPVEAGPFRALRSFTFTDAANFTARVFEGDSSARDAQGYFLANDRRTIVSGGIEQPFARNHLYWTGSEWYDCPSDGTGIIRSNAAAPFDSLFCRSYADERHSSATVTLAGRRMADVVRDIRWYSSQDFTFDPAQWGPDPAVHTVLENRFFPSGATMEYRGQLRKATPLAIATGPTSQVRVPPADTTQPFNSWPFASSMDEFIAKYPGDLQGGPLNGATTFWLHGFTLSAPPAPEYTTTVEYRVAFDANGRKARIWRNYRLASTNATAAYEKVLDTTYEFETLGGVTLMRFAAMPAGFEEQFFFQRLFAQRDGAVWYAFKDSVPAQPQFHIRLNGTALDALTGALGVQ